MNYILKHCEGSFLFQIMENDLNKLFKKDTVNYKLLIFFSLFILLPSCKNQDNKSKNLNINVIEQRFPPNTLYKSVLVNRIFQRVVISDLKNLELFEEFEYRNENWYKSGEFKSEVLGNVYEEDFLFTLTDSLKVFLNHKLDSIQKIHQLKAFRINSENYYNRRKHLNFQFMVQDGLRDKTLEFNFQ